MAAGDQGDLDLHEAGKAPLVSVEDVKRLVDLLQAHKGWITRRALADSFGGGDRAERLIRAIAEAARPAVVSFPGSPGYRLWDHCTVEEIDRCISRAPAASNCRPRTRTGWPTIAASGLAKRAA